MFNPTRDEARQFLFDAWRKHQQQEQLTPLEQIAAQVMAQHPEYHALLEDPERYRDMDYFPQHDNVNPFLHLMMHLSIAEQLSIDQPPGVREAHVRLSRKFQSPHDAEHAMMECMAEMIGQAQRNGTAPDPVVYLSCLSRQ